MADYCGIKIFDKVIIVEKTWNEESSYEWKGHKVNQGYVVDYGNTKMLETAKDWAAWTWYNHELSNQAYEIQRKHSKWDSKLHKDVWDSVENQTLYEKLNKEYYDTQKKMEGIVHEYDNGTFEIILDEAAGSSSQGGKLSFWNCIIKAADGKAFLVGISSDLLLHLMMKNTFVNGACQSKVWLGRVKGKSVGAFTENMEEFAQSKEDEKLRQQAATGNSRYIPGDIVGNYNNKRIYLGSFYEYIAEAPNSYYSQRRYIYFSKPKLVHLFSDLKEDGTFTSVRYPSYTYTKAKYTIFGHIDLTKSAFDYYKDYLEVSMSEENGVYPSLQNKIILAAISDAKTKEVGAVKAEVEALITEYRKTHYFPVTFYSEEEYKGKY